MAAMMVDPSEHEAGGPPSWWNVTHLSPEEIYQIAAHRVIIEQAKGVLMSVYDIDADDAFAWLKRQSQTHNVKLRVVAHELIRDFGARTAGQRRSLRSTFDDMVSAPPGRTTPRP
jgi:hypothetical protein